MGIIFCILQVLFLLFYIYWLWIYIRKLIDAVEDHSDQYITEGTVSSLVDVKRVFQQLLDEDERTTERLSVFLAQTKNDRHLAAKVHIFPTDRRSGQRK